MYKEILSDRIFLDKNIQPSSESSLSDLDLFVGGDGTEDDLRKALGGKHPETDASYHLVVLHQGQALVFPSINVNQLEHFNPKAIHCTSW